MTEPRVTSRSQAFAALLDACRLWLGTRPSGNLEATSLDWDAFGRMAFVHHLEPLMHHLQGSGILERNDIPPALVERWEKSYFENLLFNSRALEALEFFCKACDRRLLPVAVIKGPVPAARVFKDAALRIMVDFDILCREQDLSTLVAEAQRAGFRGAQENATYHLSLQHEELPLLLELHFRLYDIVPASSSDLETILDLREPCRLGDSAFPALPAYLETGLEIAHVVHHDLRVGLKPLLDLAGAWRDAGPHPDLKATLTRWDLDPEAAIVSRLVARLFALDISLGSCPLPPYGPEATTETMRWMEQIENFSQPALEELMARPGLSARIAYVWRLLNPPAGRLAATADSISRPSRLRHVARTVRRGWRKLVSAGLASAESTSIKQELYRRRPRRP